MALTRTLTANHWRFHTGQSVKCAGWAPDWTGRILSRAHNQQWPAYVVIDPVGGKWIIAQLRLLSR